MYLMEFGKQSAALVMTDKILYIEADRDPIILTKVKITFYELIQLEVGSPQTVFFTIYIFRAFDDPSNCYVNQCLDCIRKIL